MKQILDLIISSFKCETEVTRISDVIWEHMHSHYVECTNEYNDYTIEQFLVLFKIKYLKDVEIIDECTADSLEKLFSLKIKLENKLGELARNERYEDGKVDEEALNNVLFRLNKINNVLNKYGLVFENNDYLKMFLASVETINYQDIPKNEDIKELIKKL